LDGREICTTMRCHECYACKVLTNAGKVELRMFMEDLEFEDQWKEDMTEDEEDIAEDPDFTPEQVEEIDYMYENMEKMRKKKRRKISVVSS